MKGISVKTQNLLEEGESEKCDFKRTPDGVSADDLVAFANAEAGGCILLGIEERTGLRGRQIGHVIGCNVGDPTILQITNKALSCIPPVAIRVSIENVSDIPFLRLDILPSSTRPHCTSKGIYCRRDGSRNRPIHPAELLRIFVENEARAFAERFESATTHITKEFAALEQSVNASIENIGNSLGWTDSKLDDTESKIDAILAYSLSSSAKLKDLTTRIRGVFKQDKRKDPIYEREAEKIRSAFHSELSKDEEILNKIDAGVSVSVKNIDTDEISEEEVKSILLDVIKLVREKNKNDLTR